MALAQEVATPTALQRSRHTLNRAATLACNLGRVPDRLASLERLHNVLVLRQECRPIQARTLRAISASSASMIEAAGLRLPVGHHRFDSLNVPIKGNANLFQHFNEAVNDGIPATEARDFMNKNPFQHGWTRTNLSGL